MLALIDGDIAAYRAAAGAQKDLQWEPDGPKESYVNPKEAADAAVATVKLWADQAGASKVLVCLTGDGNFRKTILPTYKANRSGVVRPLALKSTREALRDAFEVALVDGLEADDLLGMMLTLPKLKAKAVCVSTDKDLQTVPGVHFNPAKDAFPGFVTEAQANRWWFTQALTGDACDGYQGCRKVGKTKAPVLLSEWDGTDLVEGFAIVERAFAKSGHEPGEALTSLRVARILRHGDFDKHKREVRLWHPTIVESLVLPN